ncbi:MAG: sodium/solute symporter [Spirochaetales bacterium]|nr:sodium/solute symporter [Spirochaetales bacterium]
MKKKLSILCILAFFSVQVSVFAETVIMTDSNDINATALVTEEATASISERTLSPLDIVIVVIYALLIVGLGLFASRMKSGKERGTEDYFLAGKSLPWWAIGASLIAANISAEQFVGMSGSGFKIGLAIASYEWMAALTLIIVGKYFLPIFIEKKIYTIPEFIEVRFNTTLKTILAIFWLCLFVFVNLTSVLYLGALAMKNIIGAESFPLMAGIAALALFAAAYSLWGGLSAVAWTDAIQVAFLTLGGVITTVIALSRVGDGNMVAGIANIGSEASSHLGMIHSKYIEVDGVKTLNQNYFDLPSIAVLLGGMWVANLYYWGFNQYIIQRTFAAKSLKESQKGIAFAAIIKLIIPIIVVIPGIAAYVLFTNPQLDPNNPNISMAISGTVQSDILSNDPYIVAMEKEGKEYVSNLLKNKAEIDTLIDNGTLSISKEAWALTNNEELTGTEANILAEYAGKKATDMVNADSAYGKLVNFLPTGLRGLAFAALMAAIVSSLASMLNSTSTIFTMDIYKPYIDKNASQKKLVNVGRISALVALIIAIPLARLLEKSGQVFQYIQEYTGLFSPGILAIFMLGLFWKKTTTKGAIAGAIAALPVAFLFKLPTMGFMKIAKEDYVFAPFMHQMMMSFFVVAAIIVVVSLIEGKAKDDAKGITLSRTFFKTSAKFNIVAVAVMAILVTLYTIFWSTGMVEKVFGL